MMYEVMERQICAMLNLGKDFQLPENDQVLEEFDHFMINISTVIKMLTWISNKITSVVFNKTRIV